jgi:hypothetical protein
MEPVERGAWTHRGLLTDARRVRSTGLDPSSIRRSYDRVAGRYAEELGDELDYKPLDRALMTVLVADVRRGGHGPIHHR